MLLFKRAVVYTDGALAVGDVSIDRGILSFETPAEILPCDKADFSDFDILIVPGFADAHVHLREPGFFYKEGIASGTLAAASAGYTALMSMPNLSPVPDCAENLRAQTDIIKKEAKIRVYPYAALTVGEKGEKLSDIRGLRDKVLAFSDDGKGMQSETLMREAMCEIAAFGGIIAAHCEDESLLCGGYIHDGAYAKAHGHRGICSASEYAQVERDLRLVEETGCRYHVCHVSTKETVRLIREAKRRGLPVTCETAPHYLIFTEDDLTDDGRFKMNPPIREAADREALIEGLIDGTVDIIATDHAPHSDEEKSRGLRGSLMGVVGLETAFPALYTHLVMTGRVPLTRVIDAMSVRPREIFGMGGGVLKDGALSDAAVIDLKARWTVDGHSLLSKGSSTPFRGMTLCSKNTITISDGEIIWKNAQEN